jgi:hypothetical protein
MRPALSFLIASTCLGAFVALAQARTPASAPLPKGPELTTIGRAPYVETAAHRAKLVETRRAQELQRAVGATSAASGVTAGGSSALVSPKAPFMDTVVPANGPRNRYKAGQPTAAPAASAVPVPPVAPQVKGAGKGGRP